MVEDTRYPAVSYTHLDVYKRQLVVPAMSVTIALSSPKRAFKKEDFPAFGLPTIQVRCLLYTSPQIWLMNFTGFCTVAGEDELNRKWEDWGTEADVFCLLENGWE